MEIFQAIILGIVQGLSEFLPISSSGHLVLVPYFFAWEDPGLAFDVALHFGTLLAVVAYFWRDLLYIISNFKFQISNEVSCNGFQKAKLAKKNQSPYPSNMLTLLIIGTVPGALIGFLLQDYAEVAFRNPLLIACNLILFGFLLFVLDSKSKKNRSLDVFSVKDALLIGFAQALAIVPGVSRSGATITAGLARNLDRKSAAKFSFLLSVPIIFGAALVQAKDFFGSTIGTAEIAGIIAAAVSGYLAIAGLIKFVEKASYKVFFWYRLGLGILIISFLLFR